MISKECCKWTHLVYFVPVACSSLVNLVRKGKDLKLDDVHNHDHECKLMGMTSIRIDRINLQKRVRWDKKKRNKNNLKCIVWNIVNLSAWKLSPVARTKIAYLMWKKIHLFIIYLLLLFIIDLLLLFIIDITSALFYNTYVTHNDEWCIKWRDFELTSDRDFSIKTCYLIKNYSK